MLVLKVSAKYAKEVEEVWLSAIRMIQTDETFREMGREFIKSPRFDESRTGMITITIDEDADAIVTEAFPQAAREQLAIDEFVNAA